MSTVHALIVAAGKGDRYGSPDKLWQPLQGKPLWWHAVQPLLTHPEVSGATIVVAPGDEPRFQAELESIPPGGSLAPLLPSHQGGEKGKKIQIVGVGGITRQQSVRNGLNLVPPDVEWVAVHDAARPLISHALLDRLFACARSHGAAVPVLPIYDTLKRLMPDGQVERTIPREPLYRVQTPQVFRADWLRAAHQRATDAGYEAATDDASLLEWIGYPVYTVPGEPFNIKITTPEDYAMLLRLTEMPMQIRTGIGYDIHLLVAGRKLILGGLKIEHTLGLKGHSDADVVLHAICDALLGAAALGDIGQHFPDTDPRWQDVSSLELLRQVHQMLKQQGWQIAHLDATILAEAPKLAPYVPAMRARIAETLGILQEQIGLKATTNEGMDAVGEQRAIACFALATILRPALP
ncbi:Bifunctional enzyme IspD/IspF [bacterium HR15]|nr:Bifunctional enzyme IspD/IspF [bacterium HR15]